MDKEFFVENRHYIVQKENEFFRIFLADKNGNPSIELALINYNDVVNKPYITYDMDNSFISLIKSFNNKYPVQFISYPEKLIITTDYNIYYLKKENNMFSIYNIVQKNIDRNNQIKNNSINNQLLNKLLLGKTISIGNYILSIDAFYSFLKGEASVDSVLDQFTRDSIIELIELYKKVFGESVPTVSDGGNGNVNAKVKVRRAGFANRIFMISLAGFTFGIISTLIFIIITKHIF